MDKVTIKDSAVPSAIVAREEPCTPKRKNSSEAYINQLSVLAYTFRMNQCTDDLEVNGEPITDAVRAEIRTKLRDSGLPEVRVAEDAYLAHAMHNGYHPIKDYLNGLKYYGGQPIEAVCECFTDRHRFFPIAFKKWMIGAVHRVMENGEMNPMLVLDSKQGLGKSVFVRWLAPLPDYFIEAPIDLNDKDTYIRLINKWIWEVSELGATIKRADREQLKHFISMRDVIVRKPYGRYDIRKPALSSFIGTVNNETGLLADPTGHRRFVVCHLENIDWAYMNVNVDQLWAQAVQVYLDGGTAQFSEDELKQANAIKEEYEVEDPVEGLLLKYYAVDPSDTSSWTASSEIVGQLETYGLKGTSTANLMALARTMKKLGIEKRKGSLDNGQRVWGYVGVRAP